MLSTGKLFRGRRLLLAAAVAVVGWVVLPASAQAAVCGNGILEGLEACDDGGILGGDGCSAFCTLEECGNGTLDVGEGCDPATGTTGNPLIAFADSLTCDKNCTAASCGDNDVNPVAGEDCDAGPANTNGCNGSGAGALKCKFASCPDGFLNTAHITTDLWGTHAEVCDDGNAFNNDTCDNNCRPPGCPNGITNTSEACDDANTVNADGCDSNCELTGCGNGIVTPPEACDDGNNTPGDGCSATCTVEVCGNLTLDPGEECDPPTLNICDNNCQYVSCGDGDVQTSEQCDPNTGVTFNQLIAVAESAACDINCKTTVCGNAYTNTAAGEACDPGSIGGNIAGPPGVACDAACDLVACGDGFTNTTEQCDPNTGVTGNTLLAFADGAVCDKNCTSAACPDSYTNLVAGEECDPANPTICDANCKDIQCGNGTTESTEQCDPATGPGATTLLAFASDPACDLNCKLPACGNGVTSSPETCDDGNLASGDGCDSNCTPTGCGNNIVTAGEECDGAPGCTGSCEDTVCGNGILAAALALEECDDGNAVLSDGCDFCMTDPDRDGLFSPVDVCNAIDYTIPAAATPDQNPSSASLNLRSLKYPGKHAITFKGFFNPDRNKVCSGDLTGLDACNVDADCLPLPGGTCGLPSPNKNGVHIDLRNAGVTIYSLNVAGDLQAPGGEYIYNSPTPACGKKTDGWRKTVSAATGKVTFTYFNRSGIVPAAGDSVEGTCTGSAKGLRSLALVWNPATSKWSYNGSISNTTVSPMVAVAGSPAAVQGTLQLQVALGSDGLFGTTPQGDEGQCFDNQYRGSGPGGTGGVPAATCKVSKVGAFTSSIRCK